MIIVGIAAYVFFLALFVVPMLRAAHEGDGAYDLSAPEPEAMADVVALDDRRLAIARWINDAHDAAMRALLAGGTPKF